MHCLKRDLWKASIVIVGILFLLIWVLVPVADAHEDASGLIMPGMVTMQATPTEDATMTALNKEKLAQEVQQLKEQNEPSFSAWLQANATLLSTLLVVIGGLIGLWRWFADRQAEREKRAEERFQSAVTGLGDDKAGAKVGAAILLRTFLRPGYEQFYSQAFDLATANLRLRHLDPDTPEPLTSLSQALIIVFKESFPLACKRLKQSPQFLDASCIQLDNAHLADADLQHVWLPEASLRNAALRRTDFSGAALYKANLAQADLKDAILTKTNLYKANLVSADFSNAHLSQADLRGANLTGANLAGVNLSQTDLRGADLSETNLQEALSLENTDLRGVKGLTKALLENCKARGAIIDEDLTASLSYSTVAPPPPSPDDHIQASSVPSEQKSVPAPDPDGS